jgi:hypothetical protein
VFWNRNPRAQHKADFITLYKGEDLHPKIEDAFDWADENVWEQFLPGSHDSVRAKTMLAGGALLSHFTNQPVRDFDLYFRNQKDYEAVVSNIPGTFALVPQTSERSVTYRRTESIHGQMYVRVLNLIKDKFPQSPEDLISEYDFTVTMCAMTHESIVYHPQYFMDVATRALRVYNPENATSTLYRMQKYIQRGYSIDQENMHKLLEAVQERETLPNIYTPEDQKLDAQVMSNLYGSS